VLPRLPASIAAGAAEEFTPELAAAPCACLLPDHHRCDACTARCAALERLGRRLEQQMVPPPTPPLPTPFPMRGGAACPRRRAACSQAQALAGRAQPRAASPVDGEAGALRPLLWRLLARQLHAQLVPPLGADARVAAHLAQLAHLSPVDLGAAREFGAPELWEPAIHELRRLDAAPDAAAMVQRVVRCWSNVLGVMRLISRAGAGQVGMRALPGVVSALATDARDIY